MSFTYEEYRYFKIEDTPDTSKGYEQLVDNISTIQSGKKLIPQALIDYFKLDNFNNLLINSPLNVPIGIYTIDDTVDGEGTLRSKLWEAIIQNNDALNKYYLGIDEIDATGSEIFTTFMKSAAQLIVEYYTWTTIFYASMYAGTDIFTHSKYVILPDVKYISTPYMVTNTDMSTSVNASSYDEIDSSPIYNMSHLIDAIYEIDSQMNVRNELYNSTIEDNIQLNNKFDNQDAILRDKEKRFNKEKTYVITMLSKNKRINSQYDKKKLLFIIYSVFFTVYIISVSSLLISGSTNINGVNGIMSANITLVTSILVLLFLIIYDLIQHFF
jgi:hypothetical protein